ncbi:MAG TPA: SDR family oxidoreductase [Nitriliruptorales bacterium]|jgi:NAD(P)-dependent dehydrogenase (short-subunit alcohol dehydrogenase family)
MLNALITGASRGLGHALASALVERGWNVVIDARDPDRLATAAASLREVGPGSVRAIAGDVTAEAHVRQLVAAVPDGGLHLLVNNASTLGASPLPRLAELPIEVFRRTLEVNVIAPLGLIQALRPALEMAHGAILNITSDAAVEPYETWGGYGSSKAALEQLSAITALEEPAIRVYALDPGDLRTAMHQDAFPGQDISDRPLPGTVVPAILRLIDERPPSGRYRAADLLVVTAA